MKQQCPKCGNWVVGLKEESIGKSTTAGFLGGLSSGLLSPVLGPLAFVAGKGIQNLTENSLDKALGVNYLYKCPNCGYLWQNAITDENGSILTKEQYLFAQEYEYFLEHSEEIGVSKETVDGYISKLNSMQLTCDLPKSEVYFLIAWIAYMASKELNQSYLSIAEKYIHKAKRLLNDEEYQLFALMVENKQGNRNTERIVREAIKLFSDLKSDNMLLKEEYYYDELSDAIWEEINKYKEEKIQKKKSYLIKNSLFTVPVLLFVIYKYMNYDSPEGFLSTLFSWVPIYWTILLTLGGGYLFVAVNFYKTFSRKDEEWREEFIAQYTSFKWSDLLK